jgi:hypothetical protein
MSRCCLLLLALLLTGCDAEPDEAAPWNETTAPVPSKSSFDPSHAGQVSGHVKWVARFPKVEPIAYTVPKPDGSGFEGRVALNPNHPKINASTRAIQDAVVFLRKIDPAAAAPWDLPPVKVMIGYGEIIVTQGTHQGRTGFVRRGDKIEMVSSEPAFHILRARGDDFFGITFPPPNGEGTPGTLDKPVMRTLKHGGRIELSSGAGMSWMRADLFVGDLPYYALTDANGHFVFDRVPPGQAEVVVWLPNWEPGQPIRDPESAILARPTYAPPYERVKPVSVDSEKSSVVDISLP